MNWLAVVLSCDSFPFLLICIRAVATSEFMLNIDYECIWSIKMAYSVEFSTLLSNDLYLKLPQVQLDLDWSLWHAFEWVSRSPCGLFPLNPREGFTVYGDDFEYVTFQCSSTKLTNFTCIVAQMPAILSETQLLVLHSVLYFSGV